MPPWTLNRIAELQRLWRDGLTASDVARTLGDDVTRSAVLGKVHRLGLSRPGHIRKTVAGSKPAQRAAPGRPDGASAPHRRSRPRPPLPVALPDAPTTDLIAVGRAGCRFPYGDPGGPTLPLCGRPVQRGVYCGPHAAVAYLPPRLGSDPIARLADFD